MSAARLRIVAINDVYVLTHLPRLATLIHTLRTSDPADALLVTLSGDFLAPSLLSSLDQGRGMVDCMNALGVTHVTLGNHEDELEMADLRARLEELHAKVLVSNVRGLSVRHQPSDVVEIGAFRVGLVGALEGDPTLYRRPPFEGAVFEATAVGLAREASRLRAEGCAAIVALTHQPMPLDRALAEAGIVDLVLGGHEHDGFLEPSHRAPLAKAPMNATSAIVAEVVVEGIPGQAPRVRATARLEPVVSYEEDAAMRARVESHLTRVRALEARTLCTLAPHEALSSKGSRTASTSFGTFVCSRLRDVLAADVALFNGGGLRGDVERRERLTYADLREEIPFDNEIVLAVIPGGVIADAVRFSRTERRSSGGFLQIDDRAAVDADGNVTALAGAPLDRGRLYRVATLRALLLGMDHLDPFTAWSRAHPEAVPPATTGVETKVALLRSFGGDYGPKTRASTVTS
ncbi:MAG: 5'-nucleotidase C-terminal domain-containing protein [Sandaracinus sp.]